MPPVMLSLGSWKELGAGGPRHICDGECGEDQGASEARSDKVLSNFYWPEVDGNVTRYCWSCDVCQRTVKKVTVPRVRHKVCRGGAVIQDRHGTCGRGAGTHLQPTGCPRGAGEGSFNVLLHLQQSAWYSVDRVTLNRVDIINSCTSTPVSSALRDEANSTRRTQRGGRPGDQQEEFFPLRFSCGSRQEEGWYELFCIDYRRLNKLTIFDPQPGTPPADIFQGMEKDQCFSKIDLSKGYWQIPVRKEDIPKTAFVTMDCAIGLQDENVEKVRNAPRPKTKREIRPFLGLVGYYKEFVTNFAAVSAPLLDLDLVRKGQPNIANWGDSQERAYNSLKVAATSKPVLQLPDVNKKFVLRMDASDRGLGAALMQENEGTLFPVAYAKNKLTDRERKYLVTERGALAIVWGVKKFSLYLYGTVFTLQTDHGALQFLNAAKFDSLRIMRRALALQVYNFDVL
ncbi:Zinc finger protein [Plakobranchus ocellatus]|uniref:Zinc finger protein n=1 Tax=Plakobranchus ocellatus TaxID=259542 RepID=A0AAV4BCX6_9GAST|nr:Zinc finger protein [Plakobranchus ocellatus]